MRQTRESSQAVTDGGYGIVRNPLDERSELLIDANARLDGDDCPVCGRTIDVVDVTDSGMLYICHTDDTPPTHRVNDNDPDDPCEVDPDSVDVL